MKKQIIFYILISFLLESLKSQVVINEVNVKPGTSQTSAQFQSMKDCANPTYGSEYVELYNKNPCTPIDISCYIIATPNSGQSPSTQGSFRFPLGTIIPPFGFISIGGANSGATLLLPNYCTGSNVTFLNTLASRWFLDNLEESIGLYDASGNVLDVVYWTTNPGQANLWNNSSYPGLSIAASPIANPSACANVVALAAPTSFPNSVVSYAGASPNLGTVICRVQDGSTTWITNAAATLNACNGTCNTAVSPVVCNAGPDLTIFNFPPNYSPCHLQLGVPPTAGITYHWFPSIGLESDTISNPNVYPNSNTQYILNAFDNCGNSSSDTVNVTVVPSLSSYNPDRNPTICFGDSILIGVPPSPGVTYSWTQNWTPALGLSNDNQSNPMASPSSTTVYHLEATSSSSSRCTDTIFINVNVNPSPTVSVNSPNICQGDTATIMPTGASSYIWPSGITPTGVNSGIATPLSTTTYLITGTTLGCSHTATSTVTVNPNPTPIVSIQPGNMIACSIGGTGYTYKWYLNGILQAQLNTQFVPCAIGTWWVEVTNLSGCSATSTWFPVNSCTMGITELLNEEQFIIYPNPFTSQTTISFSSEQENTRVSITDLLGKEIKTLNFTGKDCVIERGEMSNGIYFVQVTDDMRNVITKKLIIQ